MSAMSLKRSLSSAAAAAAVAGLCVSPSVGQSLLQRPFTPSTTAGIPRPLSSMSAEPVTPTVRVSSAAVVNDEMISTYDLQQRMQWMVLTTGVQPTAETLPEIQSDALEALIDERLELQELKHKAKENKKADTSLLSDDEEVSAYLTDIAKDNKLTLAQFMQQLTSRGLTEKSIREQIRIQISWRSFIQHYYGPKVRVGDDQVRQALARISAEASKPSYQTSQIFIDATHAGTMDNAMSSAAQRMQQLTGGARFDALARQFSALPTAANGGDAGWLSTGEFPAEVEQMLPTMHENEVRAIPVKDGVYIVMLRDKKAGGASTVVTLKQAAVPLPANATAAAIQAAQTKLTALKAKLNGCANIEQQAQAAGLDADDLGESDASTLSPAFRDAVLNLKPGQVSNPVRSAQGLHLLAVCDSHASGATIPSKDEIQRRLEIEQITMLQRVQLRDLRNAATITQPQ
jgi:peptidyl-prolyl cis-trans isomerase SurA